MPGILDLALVVLFAALWPLYTHFVEWPRHVRAVAAGDPRARSRIYVRTIVQQWLISAAALALCLNAGRSLALLGLRAPSGWRLALGLALPLAYAVLMALQIPAIARSPATRAHLREKLAPLRALLPHTVGEMRLFVPLATTAGICEEWLFRGYLVWVLRPWLGLFGAAGASMVVFGLAHGYQGGKFGTRAFMAGVVMGVFALVTRSILPGMALHALVDLGSGYVTHLAMREGESGPDAVGAVA
jgi:membrane protease YdiL (CAAX protease family)